MDIQVCDTQQNVICQNTSDSLESLNALALYQPQVLSVRSFEQDGYAVFALITTPIYLKSERDMLKETLRSTLQASTDKIIIVTFDNGIYRSIKPEITAQQKADLLMIAKRR